MGILNKLWIKKKIEYHPEKYYCRREDKKHYIIHHYCPHTYNAGDHFVIYSIRKHLKYFLPNSTFAPKAIAGNRGWGKPIGLRGKNIFYTNKYADAVLIGGSDQYNNWSPKITEEEIQHLVPPLFLIGLGVSSKDIDAKPFLKKEKYKTDILATNMKSRLSSVRDVVTQKFLEDLGYDKSIITGCPALFLFDEELRINKLEKRVLLTFPYPLIHQKNNTKRIQKFEVLTELINKIILILEKYKLQPVIVCHDDRDVPKAQEIFKKYPIFFSNYPEKYFDLYRNSLFIIGSRLHATILASSLGIPSININLDLRGIGFSRTFSLERWNLNYNRKDLIQETEARIEQLLDGDLTPFNDFIEVKKEYRSKFVDFMQQTAEIIKES